MSVLALSMSAITGTIYAEDQVQQTQVELSNQSTDAGVEVNSLAAEATNSSSVGTDVGTQASEAPSTENVPENNSGQIKLLMPYRRKKVMQLKRQIYKRYLLQMNVNTL
ncbi:pilus assembly protein FilC [Acinetobacter baumannii]|nr:pilus assembly protein FilC [Acinetobacter baumannii]